MSDHHPEEQSVSVDERALGALLEESNDLQSDAMRSTREPLRELVERGRERRAHEGFDPDEPRRFAMERNRLVRSSLGGRGAFATLGFGAALLALFDSPAFAQASPDVQILQTATSLEILAIETYDLALTFPFIGGATAIPTVRAFVVTTRDQHAEHAKAFNAAVKQLDGEEQTQPDPVLLDTVNRAKPTLTGLGPVVDLAIGLEDTAAQTYVANASALTDKQAREVTASIMGVEAQHVAVLLAVKALVGANLADQVKLPPDLALLPEAAGSAGFPEPFYKTDRSRPSDEGAVT
jgi:rubrerythrin